MSGSSWESTAVLISDGDPEVCLRRVTCFSTSPMYVDQTGLTWPSSKLCLSSPRSPPSSPSPSSPSPSSNKEQISCPTRSAASTPASFSKPSFAHTTFPAGAAFNPSPLEVPPSPRSMLLLLASVRLRTALYCSEPRARSKRVRQGRLDLPGNTSEFLWITKARVVDQTPRKRQRRRRIVWPMPLVPGNPKRLPVRTNILTKHADGHLWAQYEGATTWGAQATSVM